MYRLISTGGKHGRTKHTKRPRSRGIAIALALVLLIGGIVGGSYALLHHQTEQPLVNSFWSATVSIKVHEDFDGTNKENVYVENTGTATVYVRAYLVITWQDDSGNVSAAAPVEGVDYSLALGSSWTQINGIYYYNGTISQGEATENLIDSCTVTGTNGDYHLVADVMAEAVQATPEAAVKDCWNVSFSNGAWL